MNEKEKMQPKVRFREFTGENAPDWEQRKLGEVASVSMCKRIYKNQTLIEGDIPFYKIGTFGGTPDSFISRELYEEYKSKYPYPNKGDILISASGSIGRTVEFTGKDEYFQDSNIVWLNHNENILNIFLKYFYLIVKWDGIEGTTIKRLYNENILKTEISFPSITEQERIGQFFEKLDKLITLHQRKLEQLEQLKNTLLSKMFPKSGTNIPEIRFSGFADAWKQRKLEYFLEVSNEKNTDNLYSKENVLSVSGDFGVVNQIEFQGRSFAGVSVTNYGVLNTGDVVYTKSPLKANPYGIIKTNKGQPGIVSSLYGIYHTKEITVADFVQIYFEQNARLNNYLRPLVNKGAKNTILISDTEALKGRVCFAPTYEEQYIIATLFNHLDKLITFHQRNLDNLKNMKKTLLNKMFI